MPDKHLDSLIQRAFFFIIAALSIWIASSINELNRNVAVVIDRTLSQTKSLEMHEMRIEKLEDSKQHSQRSR